MKRLLNCLLAMFIGLMMVSAGQGQTPDEETPAEESICDDLIGGTPGLYGLCIAFCEAQDINGKIQAIVAGKSMPGEKILANYNKKKKGTDPDMPCIVSAPTCPCFNTTVCEEAVASGQLGYCNGPTVTSVADLFTGLSCDVKDTCVNESDIPEPGDLFYKDLCYTATGIKAEAGAHNTTPAGGVCQLWFSDGIVGSSNYLIIDPATVQICIDELNDYDGDTSGNTGSCGLPH